MTGIYLCSGCKKEFGPEGVADLDYEKKHDGIVVVMRMTETYGISDNLMFCPDCGKRVWDAVKGLYDEEKNTDNVKVIG